MLLITKDNLMECYAERKIKAADQIKVSGDVAVRTIFGLVQHVTNDCVRNGKEKNLIFWLGDEDPEQMEMEIDDSGIVSYDRIY